ncbi:hypothetical protein WN944_023314 [Citrus x changshan-huyou]|uniref:Uncharacterized protein n=1 Tax=Citrus x changshan-huyou TaxID=2935761 RepID=A0AAP0N2Z9_9ROSI
MVQPTGTGYESHTHFTYILEYMGERLSIQTVRPTRFKLLNLCFIASSALQNEDSPPNHLFRPTCVPSWLGRVVRLFSDNVLEVVIHESMKRGEHSLHILVNFTPIGARRREPPAPNIGMGVDNPVIVDMGGRFRHPIGHHTVPVPALAPPEMADLGTQAVPSLPLSGMPVNGGPICFPMPTAMSSPVVNGVQVGGATHMHVHAPPQGIMQASPQLQEFHMSHNAPAQHLMEAVRTPPPPQPHMGSNTVYKPIHASSETPSSSAKRAYKCHKCEGIGHSKRFCKITKPIATRPESSTSAAATTMAETRHSWDSAAFPHVMHGDALHAKSA